MPTYLACFAVVTVEATDRDDLKQKIEQIKTPEGVDIDFDLEDFEEMD